MDRFERLKPLAVSPVIFEANASSRHRGRFPLQTRAISLLSGIEEGRACFRIAAGR
jgi:hypothetical protein